MRHQNRKASASDFDKIVDKPFARLSSFTEEFHGISELEVEVKESILGEFEMPIISGYSPNNSFGEHLKCSNESCRKGGFPIAQLVRKMIAGGKDVIEQQALCFGYEGSAGTKSHRKCMNAFTVKVRITKKAVANPK